MPHHFGALVGQEPCRDQATFPCVSGAADRDPGLREKTMFAKIFIDDARVAAFTTIAGKAIRVPASSRQSDPYQRNPPER